MVSKVEYPEIMCAGVVHWSWQWTFKKGCQFTCFKERLVSWYGKLGPLMVTTCTKICKLLWQTAGLHRSVLTSFAPQVPFAQCAVSTGGGGCGSAVLIKRESQWLVEPASDQISRQNPGPNLILWVTKAILQFRRTTSVSMMDRWL